MVPLDEITSDLTDVRAAIDESVVAAYVDQLEAGTEFPPILLFQDGSQDGSEMHLADGGHRIAAYRRAGRSDIPAEIKPGTAEDALWAALAANKAHGHRLTPADKKHAVLRAIETWPHKRQREIADRVGCTQGYVSQILKGITRNNPAQPPPPPAPPPLPTPSTLSGELPAIPGGPDEDLAASSLEDGSAANEAETDDVEGRPARSGDYEPPTGGGNRQVAAQNKRADMLLSSMARRLGSDIDMVEAAFDGLDRASMAETTAELEKGRTKLGRLIRRLRAVSGGA